MRWINAVGSGSFRLRGHSRVPLLVRRRYPLGVLLSCAVLLFAFYTGSPHASLSPAVPLAGGCGMASPSG